MPRKKEKTIDYIPTGSTLLNLACSNRADGGFGKGKLVNIIGDSSSGKTFLALTLLASVCYDERFKSYRKFLDDVEASNEFNMENLFGEKSKQIVSPYNDGVKSSDTIQDFYYTVDTFLKDTKPFVYVLDSMDALTSEEEVKKFDDRKEAFRKGKQAKGSYGDGKAKFNSENLRKIVRHLETSSSLLLIISQTRDNIGLSFAPKIRSGGKALKFYSSYEMWMAVTKTLKKTVNGIDRVVGVNTRIKLTKNKVTGKYCEIDIPIYYQYGVDDIGSCIDYLVKEGVWEKTGAKIVPTNLDMCGTKDSIISFIEEENKEKEVRSLVESTWLEVESIIKPKRKKRFG